MPLDLDASDSYEVPLDGINNNNNDSRPSGRPGLLKSKSMDRVFGGRLAAAANLRKKTYLNKRALHPEDKDKNKGSVLKSLGKFLRDDGNGDDDETGEGTAFNRLIGKRLGRKKKKDEAAEGWATLDDDDESIEERLESLKGDASLDGGDQNTSLVFQVDTENPTAMLGNSLQLNLSVSNHSCPNTSVSTLSHVGRDDLSESSEELSCALNDSFASIGSADLPDCVKNLSRSPEVSAKKAHRKQSDRDNGLKLSSHDRSDRPATRRSRSKTSRNTSHSQRGDSVHSSRSTRSTRSTVSTKSRRALKGEKQHIAEQEGAKDPSKRSRSLGTRSTSKSNIRAAQKQNASDQDGPQNADDASTHSRSVRTSSRQSRAAPARRQMERSSSAKEIREKYQNRASLHRQSLAHKEISAKSGHAVDGDEKRGTLARQNSTSALHQSEHSTPIKFEW